MTSDGTPPLSDPRDEKRRALLRAQPWGRILTQLTAIAFKRIRGRSMSDAQDLAQSAIASAHETIERGGWDPDKGPLINLLVSRVIGAAGNERRRKRNACEVWLDEEDEDEQTNVHEKHLGARDPRADDALDGVRFASTLRDRLLERLAGDAHGGALVPLMSDGLTTPRDLAEASGLSIEDVRDARRRVRYHAGEITKELSASARPPTRAARRGKKEVTQ